MNEKNLIPQSERTKSEQREIARMGGVASGMARRERASMKQWAIAFANADTPPNIIQELDAFGFSANKLSGAYFGKLWKAFLVNGDMQAAALIYKIYAEQTKGNDDAMEDLRIDLENWKFFVKSLQECHQCKACEHFQKLRVAFDLSQRIDFL